MANDVLTQLQSINMDKALNSKRELRKLFTQWKHGNVSKREIDAALGVPQRGGKFITRLWADRLGVVARSNGDFTKV